jgi:hypothetical protein
MRRSCHLVVLPALVSLLAAACSSPQGGGSSAPRDAAPAAIAPTPAERERIFTPPPMPAPSQFRTASGAPGPGYWQQRCDYAIAATLDETDRTLTGREVITYTNNSPDPLPHLWFNLDQNLFNPASDGARMTKGGARFGNRDGFVGGFTLSAVTVNDQPAEIDVHDTLGRLDLPTPVAPRGGTVRVGITFSFPVPPYGSDRMGIDDVRDGPIFEIAQWFPNVCVYDDVYGWNTLPYLGQGEFYTNFGHYDVRLTVPRTHIVAATGVLQNPEEVLTPQQRERLSAARSSAESIAIRAKDEITDPATRPPGPSGPEGSALTWHFTADDVRTFAWASSAAFAWDACFAAGSGIGSNGDATKGQGTLCQSFYPREAAGVWGPTALGGGSSQMLRSSLQHYGAKWYAYPYPTANNINGIVGGMEYPMIIFCGGGRPTTNANEEIPSAKDAERGLFGVTTHEIGHNWFPMVVNTDEKRHAWMDEGFNTFINYYANLERYPDQLPRRGNARVWSRGHTKPTEQPVDVPADQLIAGTLGTQQYEKTSVGLVLLREGILGPDRFDAAFREYLRRWAFKSPRPCDFFRTMEDVSGADLSWFFRGWFYENGVLDQAVVSVEQSTLAAEPAGDDDARSRSAAAAETEARATFTNRAQLVMPLVFKVMYEDGTEETLTIPVQAWSATSEWQSSWNTRGRRIKELTIDPDEEFPDVDLSNNTWPR